MPLITKDRRSDQKPPPPQRTDKSRDAWNCVYPRGELFWELIALRETIFDAEHMHTQLADPDLQRHRMYGQAVFASLEMDRKLIPVFQHMAETEIRAQVYWQAFTPEEREEYGCAMNWETSGTNPDLHGQSLVLWHAADIDEQVFRRTVLRVTRQVRTFDAYSHWIRKGLYQYRRAWWPTRVVHTVHDRSGWTETPGLSVPRVTRSHIQTGLTLNTTPVQ